jgi:hypothetical protein
MEPQRSDAAVHPRCSFLVRHFPRPAFTFCWCRSVVTLAPSSDIIWLTPRITGSPSIVRETVFSSERYTRQGVGKRFAALDRRVHRMCIHERQR